MSESLSQLLKSHNQKQSEAKKQNGRWQMHNIEFVYWFHCNPEQLKKTAIQTTNELTDSITEYVNDG